ncbi:reverse transcriptase domain-containing protein [Clostridium beijerinckii]|uniref:Reverse transcriptase domain-containing protein n=1 Tax=Clostridium beijerinckii TaxID=1520 RepID=A0A7X9SMM8_CLOBE|nr:reverse transcriptase domain-containing protein [Clostridium beijerinckii]NMF04660.1 hypothetical protein [Clostridium beijerinckii]
MLLDEIVLNEFTEEKFKQQFFAYKDEKTDRYNKQVLVAMGTDGVDYKTFEKNIESFAKNTCDRVASGRFFFSPFREKEVPKPPYIDLKIARKNKKIRTLSIATIRDVIFQKLMYRAVEEYCEDKFKEIDQMSFAYRRNKSTHMAIKKIYSLLNEGYYYVLNGDIKSFYDEIPHNKLKVTIEDFFGEENKLIGTYFRRFISADRVKYEDYKGNVKKYYKKKPMRERREKGIPQGGVLSGIVANIYMYDFDLQMKEILSENYHNAKYFRYADDFVVITKHKENIHKIYKTIRCLLNEKGLYLHDIGEKTKELDLSNVEKNKLDFLGFEVSPKGIRIKKDNITKFKFRIKDKIDNTKIYKKNPDKGLALLIKKINFKILGNLAFEDEKNLCENCGKLIKERSWMNYYEIITDVRQLRSLDTWIRKQIYRKYYYCSKVRLNKETLIDCGLESLEKTYYRHKRKKVTDNFCSCKKSDYYQAEEY